MSPGVAINRRFQTSAPIGRRRYGFEIAYPLRDEEWGVRRFMLRAPSGTVVNVVSHLPH
jgi:hypothetical protein